MMVLCPETTGAPSLDRIALNLSERFNRDDIDNFNNIIPVRVEHSCALKT